jgi:hypothetical protein
MRDPRERTRQISPHVVIEYESHRTHELSAGARRIIVWLMVAGSIWVVSSLVCLFVESIYSWISTNAPFLWILFPSCDFIIGITCFGVLIHESKRRKS